MVTVKTKKNNITIITKKNYKTKWAGFKIKLNYEEI